MRRILELVQSKGEECSAYLIHVLHEAHDAYIDLRPWFSDIHYNPLESIRVIPVINTDPSEFHSVNITHTTLKNTDILLKKIITLYTFPGFI